MSHRAPAFTAERLLRILQSFPAANAYVVAFSGGADSTALLHALCAIQTELNVPLSAVHVNHGLHDDADHWQLQCKHFCHQNNIKLVCLRVDLKKCTGKGLEAEARHLRYEAISGLLEAGTAVLTAHHADDQAETLLLNLMRGSGIDGLSAMPDSRALGHGLLQRPLLGFQNTALRDYLRVNGIEWTEDPSNQYLNHDRNFVRHEIIPLLEERWPEVSKRLLLTRKAMTDARFLLEGLADDCLAQNLIHPFVFRTTAQLIENPELFRLVLRRWMRQAGAASIPAYRLESFYQQVRHSGNDHKTTVTWDGNLLHLYRHQLWLQAATETLPCPTANWLAGKPEIELGKDIGQLVMHTSEGSPEPGGQAIPDGDFSIVGRHSTKETTIKQGGHHKDLKNLFQLADVPPWLRNSIPLCQLDGELVAMGDWCFNDQFASWMSANNISLSWHPSNPLLQFIHKQQQPEVDPVGAVR